MPPCGSTTAGRPLSELVDIYIHFQSQALSEYDTVSGDIFVSRFQGLNLTEYCAAREYYCTENHCYTTCTNCKSMIQAAQMILKGGIVAMAVVFKEAFPTVTYLSVNAKRRLLQMPVVAIRIKGVKKGQNELYLMEKIEGLNYGQLASFLSENAQKMMKKQGITKEELKQLLTITQSERERELLRYAVYKTSGATPTEARRWLGFENMKSHAAHVESCIQEVQEIYEAVESLAQSQDKALLDTLGIQCNSSSESSGEETDSSQYDSFGDDNGTSVHVPDSSSLA